MHCFNIKKFQNTPRNAKGIAAAGQQRLRLPESAFQVKPFNGRTAFLHPTKGWRSRNILRMTTHALLIQDLDHLRQQSIHRMLIAREERAKQRAKKNQ